MLDPGRRRLCAGKLGAQGGRSLFGGVGIFSAKPGNEVPNFSETRSAAGPAHCRAVIEEVDEGEDEPREAPSKRRLNSEKLSEFLIRDRKEGIGRRP